MLIVIADDRNPTWQHPVSYPLSLNYLWVHFLTLRMPNEAYITHPVTSLSAVIRLQHLHFHTEVNGQTITSLPHREFEGASLCFVLRMHPYFLGNVIYMYDSLNYSIHLQYFSQNACNQKRSDCGALYELPILCNAKKYTILLFIPQSRSSKPVRVARLAPHQQPEKPVCIQRRPVQYIYFAL